MAAFPPRLHVLLARSSDRAVILRRGPSKSVCSILWDRNGDRFEEGQWLRGRIYERRSDLSPDGKHLIYFAMNGRWGSATGGSWTAISRAPWLHAIVLLGKGDGWHGGGLFTRKGRYWLNDGYGHKPMRDAKEVARDETYTPPRWFGGECPGVYYLRLLRDGWSLVDHIDGVQHDALTIFEKPLPRGWVLRKLAHEQIGSPPGKGCYWDEHELEHAASGTRHAMPDWEWAERDGNRLIWTSGGCLYRAPLPDRDGPGEPDLVRDFSAMTFRAIPAPY